MKTLITVITLLTFVNVNAQVSDPVAQAYINEVFENVQGYVSEYGEKDGSEYAMGYASEHLDFSMIRLMVGLVTSSHSDINVLQSWTKQGDEYRYGVLIGKEMVALVAYEPRNNGLYIAYK